MAITKSEAISDHKLQPTTDLFQRILYDGSIAIPFPIESNAASQQRSGGFVVDMSLRTTMLPC